MKTIYESIEEAACKFYEATGKRPHKVTLGRSAASEISLMGDLRFAIKAHFDKNLDWTLNLSTGPVDVRVDELAYPSLVMVW